jgi:hypothetical protein
MMVAFCAALRIVMDGRLGAWWKTNLIHINSIFLRKEVSMDLNLDLQYSKYIFILV